MQKKRRPSYTDEFKKRAVELSREKGVDAVAEELDISKSSVTRWRAQYGESPVRNRNGKLTSREMKNLLDEQQRRIEQLEKEKKIAEMERDGGRQDRGRTRGAPILHNFPTISAEKR